MFLRSLLVFALVASTCACGEKVCLYEQPAGKFCALMDKCSKGEAKDLVEGDDPEGSAAGRKTCESLGYACGPGYAQGRACKKP